MIYSEEQLEAILKEPANVAPSRKDLARTALAYLRSARERESLLFQATDEINRLWDVIRRNNAGDDIPAIPPPEPWPEAGVGVTARSSVDGEGVTSEIRIIVPGFADDALLRRVAEAARRPSGGAPAQKAEEHKPWPAAKDPENLFSGVKTEFYRDGERVALRGDDLDTKRRRLNELESKPVDRLRGWELMEMKALHVDLGTQRTQESAVTELFDSGPQRPHESLVWATFLAAVMNAYKLDKNGPVMSREELVQQVDIMLDWWRSRWPEEK